MFDLKHAGSTLKKIAYSEGIRANRHNAWFKPVTADNEIEFIIGDSTGKEIQVTVFDLEQAVQYTWAEVKRGYL